MNDVARLAGVSRGTVSNYINGQNVRTASAAKIETAIKQLHYVPNASAKALKTNRSEYVVLIIPQVNTPFFANLSYAIQMALNQVGYKMILCNSNSEPKEELEYIEMAKAQKVAGIITMSYSEISDLIPADIPLVAIEKKVSDHFPLIVADNYAGGQLAAKQLIDSGAKNLLFASLAPVVNVSAQRQQGFIDYCITHQMSYTRCLAHNEQTILAEFKAFIQQHLHADQFEFDGIFADADEFAGDMWHLLLQQGIRIPQDVQIIGFDAAQVYPRQPIALASIRQPITQMAKLAVQYLTQRLPKNGESRRKYQPTIVPISFSAGLTTR
ncbi:LacI family DNA-binding transcriptional regulator [Agrilactobacillus fermenti]|uniref:LacI family DNA-binding transcriptional regulator n=1 Tax=Agrilactobacillus fermenti TaxID=2586909 RepID=UPI001E376DE0|nr:LacI family DNA-binding transcriptional regulator [Agrilactobacillus fermenti]